MLKIKATARIHALEWAIEQLEDAPHLASASEFKTLQTMLNEERWDLQIDDYLATQRIDPVWEE